MYNVRRCKIADEIVDEEKSRDKKRYEYRGNMQKKRVTQEDRIALVAVVSCAFKSWQNSSGGCWWRLLVMRKDGNYR